MGDKIVPRGFRFTKISLILCLLGLGVYFNAIFFPFVHDDIVFIQNNPTLNNWKSVPSLFFHPSTAGQSYSIVNAYYRPFLEILYKTQYFFFSLDPRGYHLFNILLHITNSILVYGLFWMLLGGSSFISSRQGIAFGVATFFLVHPIQTEAVACVAGVSNLVFTFFCLLSCILYVYSALGKQSRSSIVWYFASLVAFIFALFSKEQAVVLPMLIVLYEYFYSQAVCIEGSEANHLGHRYLVHTSNILRVAGFFVIVIGFLFFRSLIAPDTLSSLWAHPHELVLRILQIPKVLLTFLGILIFPVGLHYYRSVDILQPFLFPSVVLGIVFICLVWFIKSTPRNYRGGLIFGMAWFLFALLPTLNIVPLVNEYSIILTAEHFLYLPMIGFVFFMILVVRFLSQRMLKDRATPFNRLFFSVVLVICVFLTIKQNFYWRGEIPLFERVVLFENNFGRGHILLGKAYYFHKEYDRAIVEYKRALNIFEKYLSQTQLSEPRKFYMGFIKGIYFDLAHAYEDQGEIPSAIEEYEHALALDSQDAILHNNVGVSYIKINNFAKASEHFQKAVELNPRDLMAANNLAICKIQSGDVIKAKEILSNILKIDPHFGAAQQNLERLQNSSGR